MKCFTMPENSDSQLIPGIEKDKNELTDIHSDNKFRIHLSVFEGPADLLLYLIKKSELDIHEISLSKIVKEYLEYVELIKLIDLESAGDFIVVASALLKIKARSMFQPQEEINDEQEEMTTKDALIKYLMEFEKLGGVAEKLAEKEQERLGVFPRGGERSRISEYIGEKDSESDYVLFDLLTALRDVLKNAPKSTTHDVELLNVTSEMKQNEIMEILSSKEEIDFIEFVSEQPRLIIVVTFIAMLELIKAAKISIRQSEQFGRIILYERSNN
jgi:segregation and condensation protein A